jgi:uncharacterized protein YbcI
MKTQGEIESAISEGMSRFQQEYMGRGPKDVHVHLINDLVVCRLKGVLTAAEEHLVKTLPADKGRDLLKQVRSHLMETARPIMEAMVQDITGTKVLTLHHDISTLTGEEVVLFTLAELPPGEKGFEMKTIPLPAPKSTGIQRGAAPTTPSAKPAATIGAVFGATPGMPAMFKSNFDYQLVRGMWPAPMARAARSASCTRRRGGSWTEM